MMPLKGSIPNFFEVQKSARRARDPCTASPPSTGRSGYEGDRDCDRDREHLPRLVLSDSEPGSPQISARQRRLYIPNCSPEASKGPVESRLALASMLDFRQNDLPPIDFPSDDRLLAAVQLPPNPAEPSLPSLPRLRRISEPIYRPGIQRSPCGPLRSSAPEGSIREEESALTARTQTIDGEGAKKNISRGASWPSLIPEKPSSNYRLARHSEQASGARGRASRSTTFRDKKKHYSESLRQNNGLVPNHLWYCEKTTGLRRFASLATLRKLYDTFHFMDTDHSATISASEFETYITQRYKTTRAAGALCALFADDSDALKGRKLQVAAQKLEDFFVTPDCVLELKDLLRVAYPEAGEDTIQRMYEVITKDKIQSRAEQKALQAKVLWEQEMQQEAEKMKAWVDTMWATWDADGNGELDEIELEDVLRQLGGNVTDIHRWMQEIDTDCSGLISQDEFTEWWVGKRSYKKLTLEHKGPLRSQAWSRKRCGSSNSKDALSRT
ncbi:hypothetical protein CYMTET_54703 [Cymbomonas tetramitiformis]|uniref:EF-hand domain-containing protein n=1 Tax=Cymbomonas tetramitiformis TaxID=36881 RepID=A0AAE0BED1_9CHLO|nr:hypothetical protein CYMTET_54703 [Cymbomonas tetramitiformis]